MPAFISSAVGSKKAAPKAPARRRPAPPAAPPPKQVQAVEPSNDVAYPSDDVAPRSPPATQQEPESEQHARIETPPRIDAPPPQVTRPRAVTPPPAEPQPEPETLPPVRRIATPPPIQEHVHNLFQPVREHTPEATQPEARTQSPSIEEAAQEETQPVTTITSTPAATQDPPPEQSTPRTSARAGKKRKSNDGESQQTELPAKKQKKNSARSNATVQTAINEDGGAPAQAGGSTKKAPRPAKQKAAGTEQGKSKRRPTAKSAAIVIESPEPGQEEAEGEDNPEEAELSTQPAVHAPKRKKRKKKSQKAKGQTEEEGEGSDAESDPEAHEIDPKTLTLYDLSHDSIHGKVSDREKKMAEINWDEVARKKYEEIERIRAGKKQGGEAGEKDKQPATAEGEVLPSVEGPDGASEAGRTPQADGEETAEGDAAEDQPAAEEDPPVEEEPLGTVAGPQLIMVNGELVLDETSLNRPNEAAADDIIEEIEEENDLTQRLNRTTWLTNRRRDPTERVPAWRLKSDPWGNEETDRFYDALKMFGTDFFIISKMFEPKTRKQIKLKFNREEKLDPLRIKNALLGLDTKPMDLQHYARETGEDISVFQKYDSFAHAEEVIRDSMKDKEEAMQAAIEEEEENQRQAKVQAGQKEEAKKIAERKRAEKRAMKAANKGRKIGAGTMGGD